MLLSSCMMTRPVTVSDYRKIDEGVLWTAIVPGLPQFLNGEYLKGALFFAGSMIPAAVGANLRASNPTNPVGEIITYTGSAVLGWSIVDAFGTTMEMVSQRAQVERELGITSKYSKSISLGMSQDDVIAIMGRPSTINRSVGSWGVHEQWVYKNSKIKYIYIENGILSSWQN